MMAGESETQLPKRSSKLEWNLNTIMHLLTLGVMLIGGVMVWVASRRDVEDLLIWEGA
jgi:hypothetical protein